MIPGPRILAAILATLLLAAGCGSSGRDEHSDGTLRIGIISPRNELYDPIGYLQQKGELLQLLKPAGITDVKVLGFGKGPDLNQALLAGSLDVGILGDTPALVAKAQGVDVRLIGQDRVGMDAAISVRRGGPTSIKDLQGKRIGTTTGGYTHRYLRGVLQQYGVSADIENIPNQDQLPALQNGSVDAVATSLENALEYKDKGMLAIDTTTHRPELAGDSVVVARTAYLQQHPNFADAWRSASETAAKTATTDWNAFLAFSAKARGYSIQITAAADHKDIFIEPQLSPRLLQDLDRTEKFLLAEKYITKDFSIKDWTS